MNREREFRTGAAVATSEPTHAAQQLEQPVFIDELAAVLGTSVRTLQRMLRAGSFPIPTLSMIDRSHRWSRAAVRQWLTEGHVVVRVGARDGRARPRLVAR